MSQGYLRLVSFFLETPFYIRVGISMRLWFPEHSACIPFPGKTQDALSSCSPSGAQFYTSSVLMMPRPPRQTSPRSPTSGFIGIQFPNPNPDYFLKLPGSRLHFIPISDLPHQPVPSLLPQTILSLASPHHLCHHCFSSGPETHSPQQLQWLLKRQPV